MRCGCVLQCTAVQAREIPVTDPALSPLLARIADALDRLAPPPRPVWDLSTARLFRCDGESLALTAAPDYPLPVDLLLGRMLASMLCEMRRRAARSWIA